jgi:signal transduction histidine kinase
MHTISTEPGEVNMTSLSSIMSEVNVFEVETSESLSKILIVDDERHIAEEIAELLNFDDFMQCEIAGNAIQAMDMIEMDETISVIVTDVKMPGQDGLTMVHKLRNKYADTREFGVIVITGHAGTDEAIEALRLGAMDFITKPISPDHLLHAVGRAVEILQLRILQKQFHEHLEYKVEERTQEVRLLSDDLTSANQKLQSLNLELSASNRIKSEFLSMIKHELRTPLTPILGFAELIAISSEERGDMKEHKYSKKISKAGLKLLRTINTMLDLVDVDSGDINLSLGDVNLTDIVDRVIDVLKPKAESFSIQLSTVINEHPITIIQGDEKRLMQAIYNIMDNSIQHSPSDSHVVVEVRSLDESLSVSVSDNGVGMNEEDLKIAREAFRQVEGGHKRTVNGIGLGLTLSNMFIELHGGKISISTEKGQGTKVEMIIPKKL